MSRPATALLHLAFDLPVDILYDDAGLTRMDCAFIEWLGATDEVLAGRLLAGRDAPDALDDKAHSALLLDLAPYLEDFIGTLFGIGAQVRTLQARLHALAPLYVCKRQRVRRRARSAPSRRPAKTARRWPRSFRRCSASRSRIWPSHVM